MPEHSLLRDLGLLLLFGFFGAWLAAHRGHSVIVGYILIGVGLGPHAFGIISDATLIRALSELGVVLLLFFLGVEFSLERLRRVRTAVLLIGTGELLANLTVGFLVGYILGWSVTERAFLAGIVAMSSSGIVAKLLIEWRRTANPEAEALMGIMVFEDFIAVLYLGVLSGLAIEGTEQTSAVFSLLKAIAFYAVFLGVGRTFLPRLLVLTLRIRSEELFALLWLAVILLSGMGAAQFGLAPAAGAFLLGMLSPTRESDLGERLYDRLESFRDVFLALFFLAFGMSLEPESLRRVLPLVLLLVPLSILTELVITSSLSFLVGFSAPVALAIGAGMIPRGEYSLLYATLGQQLGLIRSDLFQLAGWYVFAMTLLAPLFMKNTRALARLLDRFIPKPIAFAGTLIAATLQPITFSADPLRARRSSEPVARALDSPLSVRDRLLIAAVLSGILALCLVAFAIPSLSGRALLLLIGSLLLVGLRRALRQAGERLEAQVDRSRFQTRHVDPRHAVRYTAHVGASVLLTALLIATSWPDVGAWGLVLLPLLVPVHIGRAWRVYRLWNRPELRAREEDTPERPNPPPGLAAR